MPKAPELLKVTIDKLVHGGQGIGTLENGKKALVWGVLPGEKVTFYATKVRRDFVEGVVKDVVKASSHRIDPRDDLYISTSPWQIMPYDLENDTKKQILADTLARAGINYDKPLTFHFNAEQWNYRNKMEYSFYGDDDGLHLALFNRGSHRKQAVDGSSLARPEIDIVANKICKILDKNKIRASDLKSVVIRCDQKGACVVAVYVRNQEFKEIAGLNNVAKGIVVTYSNPKSPASVRTQDLYKFGDISLTDTLLVKPVSYDVFSFFQGNLPIFQKTLKDISDEVNESPAIDMFSGVGAIGLSLPSVSILVESDANNVVWARKNTGLERSAEVIHATSERALEYIDSMHVLIVDPPRSGLHKDLTDQILNAEPPKVLYLSCNPSTQARDLSILQERYAIKQITGYNYFPRTPHIESLAILELR